MTMPDGTPKNPWHPRTQPVGLDFDRADTDQPGTVRPQPLGIGGWIPVKDCCGVVVGERCRCACQDTVDRIELDTATAAPVIVLHAYDLRWLREHHVTAAELHSREVA